MNEYVNKSFREKLEDSVEPALKVVAYILLVLGIIFTFCFAFASASVSYIGGVAAFFIFIGGLISSYLAWAGIMFALRIGANINRIREIMEEKASK